MSEAKKKFPDYTIQRVNLDKTKTPLYEGNDRAEAIRSMQGASGWTFSLRMNGQIIPNTQTKTEVLAII